MAKTKLINEEEVIIKVTSFDVIVIGGGLAALSAAIEAANLGSSVALINKGITGVLDLQQKQRGYWQRRLGMGIPKIDLEPIASDSTQKILLRSSITSETQV